MIVEQNFSYGGVYKSSAMNSLFSINQHSLLLNDSKELTINEIKVEYGCNFKIQNADGGINFYADVYDKNNKPLKRVPTQGQNKTNFLISKITEEINNCSYIRFYISHSLGYSDLRNLLNSLTFRITISGGYVYPSTMEPQIYSTIANNELFKELSIISEEE